MEISDIRKADAAKKAALKAKADQYVAEQAKPDKYAGLSIQEAAAAERAALVAPILCGSCRHWEAPDAKAVFAACGLSRHSGLPTAMATTDKMTCSRAEKR